MLAPDLYRARALRSGSIIDSAPAYALDRVLDSELVGGRAHRRVRARVVDLNRLDAVAFTGRALRSQRSSGPASAATVLCPSNTFMATPLAAIIAVRTSSSTATATYACRSRTSSGKSSKPAAPSSSCTSGHLAFQSDQIADLSKRGHRPARVCATRTAPNGTAAVQGAGRPGSGRSPTKTISTGEAACSFPPPRRDRVRPRVPQLRQPDYAVHASTSG